MPSHLKNAVDFPYHLYLHYEDIKTFSTCEDAIKTDVSPGDLVEMLHDKQVEFCGLHGDKHLAAVSTVPGRVGEILVICNKPVNARCGVHMQRIGSISEEARADCEMELQVEQYCEHVRSLIKKVKAEFAKTRQTLSKAAKSVSDRFLMEDLDFQENSFPRLHALHCRMPGLESRGEGVGDRLIESLKEADIDRVIPAYDDCDDLVEDFIASLAPINEEAGKYIVDDVVEEVDTTET
ncbi:hypothetical protein SCHPADRAFT_947543 [Schizopora paradoxa]|uniref:Uncharacterized protein n=1 Tax=Schizopora paradoxa TaxID=27342 RepID=A0A0H2R078_9AGAM|nr:hypothetical protein SCHPADRAFT_947543 [Schizopora paradoxa]